MKVQYNHGNGKVTKYKLTFTLGQILDVDNEIGNDLVENYGFVCVEKQPTKKKKNIRSEVINDADI